MKGFRGLSLALLLSALIAPAAATAQQKPKDTKYTKDAGKFLGLAMMRQDGPDKDKLYQDALNAMQEGFEKDVTNPKFWLTAGQVYAGLGQLDKANEAFNTAVQLYPEYEEEVAGERENAWMVGFSRGVELMDGQNLDQALAMFNAANAIYPHRPEAWLNIGSIYANQGNTDKAIEAFEKASEAAGGPMLEKLEPEAQAQWKSYQEMSAVNIAQMRGAQGVAAFEQEKYKEAEDLFRKAVEVNPHSRDYLFNIVQARYAQATKLEEQLEQKNTAVTPDLQQLYAGLKEDIKKVQSYDPNNETLYMILARAHKRQAELAGDTSAAQQGVLAVLTELENIGIEVDALAIQPNEDNTAQITGTVKNRSKEAGAPVTIKLVLMDRAGATIGEQSVTLNAPEKDQTANFTATAQIKGAVAGWKYVVS
jgi:tetratricopeptide (TPR) repeat protein